MTRKSQNINLYFLNMILNKPQKIIFTTFFNSSFKTIRIVSLERLSFLTQLIQQTAQSPDIIFFIIRLFLTQLGTQVKRSSNNRISEIFFFAESNRHAEISDFNKQVTLQKNVHGFDVSV